jgi:hypothetical protein
VSLPIEEILSEVGDIVEGIGARGYSILKDDAIRKIVALEGSGEEQERAFLDLVAELVLYAATLRSESL